MLAVRPRRGLWWPTETASPCPCGKSPSKWGSCQWRHQSRGMPKLAKRVGELEQRIEQLERQLRETPEDQGT
jgi:hypothetical protein